MAQVPIAWREVHRHRGVLTALAWSPSGDYLSCSAASGEVVVIEANTFAVKRLLNSPADKHISKKWVLADWDQKLDVLGVDTHDGFGILDLQGNLRLKGECLWTWKMRARPRMGGYACVQHDAQKIRIVFIDSDGSIINRSMDLFPSVADLSWSCTGEYLAVACPWGVSIFQHGSNACELAVPGGANAVVWLNAARFAVGCIDTCIRIYEWTSSEPQPDVEPLLIDVLEQHDAAIFSLASQRAGADFASVDESGLVCLWTQGMQGFELAHSSQQSPCRLTPDFTVACHPSRPLVAIDVDRVVSIAEYSIPVTKSPVAAAAEGPVSIVDAVLSLAGLIGVRTHCDKAGMAWEVAANPCTPPCEEEARRTRLRKRIAHSTRSLVGVINDALRMLWHKPLTHTQIELEHLAFITKGHTPDPLQVRQRLLALLATEILADRPRLRELASAGYVGLAHLGLHEAEAGFATASLMNSLLPRLNESLRQVVYTALLLLPTRDVDSVAAALETAAAALDGVVSKVRSQGIPRISTDVPHTLILKGGGAKGLAHVGAWLELSQYFSFDHFAGTSAGAVIAVLLGADMKAPELQAELLETDFSALVREPWWQCLLRLVLHGGLHTGNGIENWVDTLLLNKLNAHSRVRLRDLLHTTTVYACQGDDPTVTFASNDPATRDEYAAYAVRCSMSIPFFFTPGRKGGMHIFDGGLKQNYPVEELLKHSPHAAFIGLYLGAPYEPDAGKGVVKAFWESLFEANDKVQLEKHKEHTVIIDTRPVTTLDFKLSKTQKQFLLLSGRVAALKFLKNKKIDLADRADMEELMQAHDELRQSLLLARAERLQWRWRAAWGTLLLIVAVAWSSRLV